MVDLTLELRKTAKELLEKGEVKLVMGWEKGNFPYSTTPVFIDKPEEADRLVWDEYCTNNLALYMLDYKHIDGKVAIFVKGCDSRGINRLIQDKQLDRGKVILIGLSCPGMKDEKIAKKLGPNADIPMAQKCQECRYPDPVVYDSFLGEKQNKKVPEKIDLSEVEAIEEKTPDEKYQIFTANYEKCLRCYACRNVCPACNCKECIFDQNATGWLAKANNTSNNMFFGLTRAMHVAGRCIECGECERVCSVNIPIMLLNKKIMKDINFLFGDYDAGLETEERLPLGGYDYTDPEEFM